jgi:hypothetical protein
VGLQAPNTRCSLPHAPHNPMDRLHDGHHATPDLPRKIPSTSSPRTRRKRKRRNNLRENAACSRRRVSEGEGVTRRTLKNDRSARRLKENGAIPHEMKQKRYPFTTETMSIHTRRRSQPHSPRPPGHQEDVRNSQRQDEERTRGGDRMNHERDFFFSPDNKPHIISPRPAYSGKPEPTGAQLSRQPLSMNDEQNVYNT